MNAPEIKQKIDTLVSAIKENMDLIENREGPDDLNAVKGSEELQVLCWKLCDVARDVSSYSNDFAQGA